MVVTIRGWHGGQLDANLYVLILGQFVVHKWESDTRTEEEMIGNGMTSERQILSQQEMSVAMKKK